MSYVSDNVRSSGEYRYETSFSGLPDDETERNRYARFMRDIRNVEGVRYLIVSRTTEREREDASYDPETETAPEPETETETTVFVMPSVRFITDALAQLGAFERNGSSDETADYYSSPSEYYEAVIRNYVSVPSPVTESYHTVVSGLSPVRREIIESAAGIRR